MTFGNKVVKNLTTKNICLKYITFEVYNVELKDMQENISTVCLFEKGPTQFFDINLFGPSNILLAHCNNIEAPIGIIQP